MLMNSMGRYVHRRITTKEGKEAYRKAMHACIGHVSSGLLSLAMIKARVEGVRDEHIHLYPKKMFNSRREEINCHNMAVDQAMDIVMSIEARFILGQSDDGPRGYRNRGWLLYEDQSLFGRD